MRLLVAICAMLAAAGTAQAADLTVVVRTPAGKPVSNAVVMVNVEGAPPARPEGAYRMSQQRMQFDPFVLVVPAGAEVAFPNLDPVRHHVYSFSPTKTFELKLYGQGQAPAVRFDRAGVAAIGCNIHDSMVGFIRVVDTPFAAKTDAQGRATIRGVRGGQGRLTVWHPYGKGRGGEAVAAIAVQPAGAQAAAMTLDVRGAPLRHGAY